MQRVLLNCLNFLQILQKNCGGLTVTQYDGRSSYQEQRVDPTKRQKGNFWKKSEFNDWENDDKGLSLDD